MLFEIRSEFGTFFIQDNLDTYELYLGNAGVNIKIGKVKKIPESFDNIILIKELHSRFTEIYLKILRTEIKYGMFLQLPLTNPFKDAFLRMRIEDTGQTLLVREFEKEGYTAGNWTQFNKYAEFFDIDAIESDMVFVTPYTRYSIDDVEENRCNIYKERSISRLLVSEISIPYVEAPANLKGMLYRHAIGVIETDTFDMMNIKFNEIGKRTADVFRYMFGMDKLRVSLKNITHNDYN